MKNVKTFVLKMEEDKPVLKPVDVNSPLLCLSLNNAIKNANLSVLEMEEDKPVLKPVDVNSTLY
jgi:hypothetical protein